MICIEDLPWQFDTLLARLHQQSMLIFAMIALGHPKSALEPFNEFSGPRGAFYRVTLPRWHTGSLNYSKAVYFATTQ